jgi:hypothetical protein
VRYAFRSLAAIASEEVAKPDTIIDSGVLNQIHLFLKAAEVKMAEVAPDSTSLIPQLPPQTQPLPVDSLAAPLFDGLRRGMFYLCLFSSSPSSKTILFAYIYSNLILLSNYLN